MTRFKQYLRYVVAQQALSISLHDPRHPLIEPHHPVLDGVAEAVGCVGILVLFHLNARTSHGVGVGMRCGVVASLLSNEKETKHVIDFALMMAEYVLQEQCRLFGDVLRKQYAADADDPRRNSKNRAVFDRLADTFTSHDILALKNDISDAVARMIIKRWREAGWIEPLPRQKGR